MYNFYYFPFKMFSLYVHIPFCAKKCNYCSFYVIPSFPGVEEMKDKYLQALKKEILQKKVLLKDNKLYTIYFWGWTPSEFGIQRTKKLLNFIKKQFDISNIEEFSLELNPNPLNQTTEFINSLKNEFWPWISRFSVWIQSLENKVLQKSGRNYDYKFIEQFLNSINKKNYKLNLDFIAFGIEKNLQIFDKFLEKYEDKIDSLSIYTLELFPWSIWHTKYKVDENKILENFWKYLEIVKKHNFHRYEISNFAKSKDTESKHNKVYWNWKDYLWIWTSASSFIQNTRYTNSFWIPKYLQKIYEYKEQKILSEDDLYIEKIFLSLRTNIWLNLDENIKKYLNITKLENFIENWYIKNKENKIFFTDKWFLVYNYLITEILRKI